MAKRDFDQTTEKRSSAKSYKAQALVTAAFVSATAISGGYAWYHQDQIENTAAQRNVNKLNDMSVEELIEIVPAQKLKAERELDASESDATAALRNWATASQKEQEILKDLLTIRNKVDREQVPQLHDALETYLDILRQPEYKRPFGDVIAEFSRNVGQADTLLGGYLDGVILPPAPTGDEDQDKKNMAAYKTNSPTIARIREQNQHINEWVKPAVNKTVALDYNGTAEGAVAFGLFKEMDKRITEISDELKILESQVKDQLERTERPKPDIEEKRQHEEFLKTISDTQDYLRSTHTELTGSSLQNVDIVQDRLGRAVTMLEDTISRLEKTIDQLGVDIDEQHAIIKDGKRDERDHKLAQKKFDRMDDQLQLVEDQLKLTLAIKADVGFLHALTEKSTLNDKLIEHTHELTKDAESLKTRLETKPKDKAEAESMAQDMEKLEAKSAKFEGEVLATFLKLDKQDGGYARYRRMKKDKPADFMDADQRAVAIKQLGQWISELEESREVWSKASQAEKEFRAERADIISPERIRQQIRRLWDIVAEESKLAEKLAEKYEIYKEKSEAWEQAEDGQSIMVAKMGGRKYSPEPVDPNAPVVPKPIPEDQFYPYAGFPLEQPDPKDKNAKKQYQREDHAFDFNYQPPPPPEPVAPQRSGGGSGRSVTGSTSFIRDVGPSEPYNFPMTPPKDFPGYYDPNVPAREKFDHMWGQGGDGMRKEQIFEAVESRIGHEPMEVTSTRINSARKGYAMNGVRGPNCVAAAGAQLPSDAARVFSKSGFGTGRVNGQSVLRPISEAHNAQVGDKVIFKEGGWVTHVATIQDKQGDLFSTGNGNAGTGYKISKLKPMGQMGGCLVVQGGHCRPGTVVGWVSVTDLVREAERQKAAKRQQEGQAPEAQQAPAQNPASTGGPVNTAPVNGVPMNLTPGNAEKAGKRENVRDMGVEFDPKTGHYKLGGSPSSRPDRGHRE